MTFLTRLSRLFQDNEDTQRLLIVALFGAIGGALGWEYLREGDVTPGPIQSAIALGAEASVVFVFLIASPDPKQKLRMAALALLAGFFPDSVWEAGKNLIDHREENVITSQASGFVESAAEKANLLATLPEEEQEAVSAQIENDLETARMLAMPIRDPRNLAVLQRQSTWFSKNSVQLSPSARDAYIQLDSQVTRGLIADRGRIPARDQRDVDSDGRGEPRSP